MRIETVRQFSVFLPNQTGALRRLAALLAEKGVNVLGIASENGGDSGVVRLALPEDADASALLTAGGFSSVETRAVSVELDDRPGRLLALTEALAAAKVNLTTVYGAATEKGRAARLILAAKSADQILAVLEKLAQESPIR